MGVTRGLDRDSDVGAPESEALRRGGRAGGELDACMRTVGGGAVKGLVFKGEGLNTGELRGNMRSKGTSEMSEGFVKRARSFDGGVGRRQRQRVASRGVSRGDSGGRLRCISRKRGKRAAGQKGERAA